MWQLPAFYTHTVDIVIVDLIVDWKCVHSVHVLEVLEVI